MADTEQGIHVKFTADASGIKKGAKEASSAISDLGSELRSGISDFAKWGVAATAAGAAILGGIVVNSATAAKELKNLAAVSNTSVAEFQKLAFAAKSVGIEQDKLSDIYKDMKDRVGDFISTGAGPMADFFTNIAPKVGVTAESFRKLSGPESLQLFVSSLEKANLSQAEMTFYMEQLASDSTKLLPLLAGGGAALSAQAREAERLGIVLSDIDHQRLLQAATAMTKGEAIASSFADQLSANLAPAVVTLGNQFTELIVKEGGAGNAAKKMADMIIDGAGFAINAIDGLKRVFEVAADGMIVFAMKFGHALLDYVTMPIRGVLELASNIPGVIGEQSSAILAKYGEITGQMEAVSAEAGANIAETLLAPMAGDGFKDRVKKAFADSTAAANEALAQSAATVTEGTSLAASGGDPGAQSTGTASTAEDDRMALEEKLAVLQESLMTENEVLMADYETKRALALQARENNLIDELAYGELELSIEAEKQAKLNAIEARSAEERKRLAQMEANAKKQIAAQYWSDFTTGLNSNSRKVFEITKKIMLADAIMTGYRSAIKAWDAGMATGGPWAPAVAAAYTAASLIKTGSLINSIRSQQFGGGGSSNAGGGGAVSNTAAVSAASTGVSSGGGVGSPMEVRFTGISADRNYSGREISTIYDKLIEESGNRGVKFLPMGA